MNLLKLFLVVAVAVGAYKSWQQDKRIGASPGTNTVRGTANGFVSLPAVLGQSPSAVIVVAAENCPHEDAQRADRLAEDLSRSGVPVVRAHSIGFDTTSGDQDVLGRINRVMTGQLPIVFVRGRAKANPTLSEVLAEFRGSAQ